MLIVAVGLSSQTGVIYSLLGTTGKAKKQSWFSRLTNRLEAHKEKETDGQKQAALTRRTGAELDAEYAVANNLKKTSDNEFEDEQDGDEEQSVLQKKLALIAIRIGKLGDYKKKITLKVFAEIMSKYAV